MINNTQEVDDYTDNDAAIDNCIRWVIGLILVAIGIFWGTS